MTALAILAALALLLLISVAAGLVGFATLGALRFLEGGLSVQPARVVVDAPSRPTRPPVPRSLLDTSCHGRVGPD